MKVGRVGPSSPDKVNSGTISLNKLSSYTLNMSKNDLDIRTLKALPAELKARLLKELGLTPSRKKPAMGKKEVLPSREELVIRIHELRIFGKEKFSRIVPKLLFFFKDTKIRREISTLTASRYVGVRNHPDRMILLRKLQRLVRRGTFVSHEDFNSRLGSLNALGLYTAEECRKIARGAKQVKNWYRTGRKQYSRPYTPRTTSRR